MSSNQNADSGAEPSSSQAAANAMPCDEHGHLLDWLSWAPAFAEAQAQRLGLSLTDEHWEIIAFLRDHYRQFGSAPPMRLLSKAVSASLGPEKGSSRYLYRLFPDGPGKVGSLLAGLPKPVSCI